jgi:hypothetical protein
LCSFVSWLLLFSDNNALVALVIASMVMVHQRFVVMTVVEAHVEPAPLVKSVAEEPAPVHQTVLAESVVTMVVEETPVVHVLTVKPA